jgi:hypothetical protein
MSGRHALDGQRRDNARARWHRATTTARDTWTRVVWLVQAIPAVLTTLTTRRRTRRVLRAIDLDIDAQYQAVMRRIRADSATEADRAIDSLMADLEFGNAGARTPTVPNPVISRHALPRVAGGAPVPPGAPEAPAPVNPPSPGAGASPQHLLPGGPATAPAGSRRSNEQQFARAPLNPDAEWSRDTTPLRRLPWVITQPPPGSPLGYAPVGRVELPRADGRIVVDERARVTVVPGNWRQTVPNPVVQDPPVVPRWYRAWLAAHPEAEVSAS